MARQVLNVDAWLIEVEPFTELIDAIVDRTDLSRIEAMTLVAVTKLNGVQLQVMGLAQAYNALAAQTAANASRSGMERHRESLRNAEARELQVRALAAMERALPHIEREADDLDHGDDWLRG